MAQTRRSTARGLEQVPSRRLSAVPAEEAASAAARRGKRRGRIKYRIFTLGLGLDMTMLFLILVLLAVGLVMMFSASYAYAYYYYGNSYYFILRQGMFALVGVVLMLAISTFDYHQLHKLNLPVFAVSILLLLMVLVFKGTKLAPNKGGAVRWLNLGFVEFQPSEIAKFALILMFAHLIALYGERMKTFRYGFLPFFGILGLICVLVIAEKHVSATIIICLIAFIMMFVGGTKFRYFAVIGGAAAAAIGALVLFSSKFAYAMDRVHGWLDPFNPPEGVDTWQTVQSLYAIGSGQLLGVGIGLCLFLLPLVWKDFALPELIFAPSGIWRRGTRRFPGNLTETSVRCNHKPDSRMIPDYFLSADMRCLCKRNRILIPRRLNHPVLIILHMSRRPIHHKANTVDQSYLHLDIIGNMNRNRFFRNKLRFRRHNRPPCRTLRKFIPGLFPFMNIINSRQHHQIHKTFDKSGFSCTYRPYNANIDLAARSHLNISIYTQFIHKNTPSISILQSFHILYERGMPLRRMNYLYRRILSLLSRRQFKEHILL